MLNDSSFASCGSVMSFRTTALIAALVIITTHAAEPPRGSWPEWRGPNRDGTTTAFTPPVEWPAALARQWSVRVGAGHASPVIADGRVFVHARSGEQEVVVSLDAETGKELWRDAYDAPYRVNPAAAAHGPGPKSTPVVSGGRLITFGISGILSCYDASTGARRWRKQPVNDQPVYGTGMSPLVDGRSVVVHVGGHESGALTAFDLTTGDARWRWTGGAPAYASPILTTLFNVRQIVTQSRTHVVGVSAADGRLLWEIPFTTDYDQSAVTAVAFDDLIIYSGLAKGIHAVRPVVRGSSWRVEPVWDNEAVSMYMSSPVLDRGTLFGLSHRNRGQFFALDPRTGRTLWMTRGREAENAALVMTGGVGLTLTTNSELIVWKPGTAGFQEIRRYDVADTPTWAHPAVVGRQIVVKDADSVIAWSVGR
jgi:outer membrane protein assembly factor BamB